MPQTLSPFPVVHSVLAPAALLRHVTTHYDIGSPIQCILLRSWINEVYSVQTSRGRFMLKVFRRGWRAPEEVAYEVELMQHLANCGVRVEPPIATRTGATVCVLPALEGQRPAVVYPMLLGRPPVPPSETIYHQVGCAIARMHQALDTFAPTRPRRALDVRYLAEEPLSWLRPHFDDRQADWEFLLALVQRVQAQLDSLEQTGELSRGVIHGDATLDNLLITDDGQIGIYDFDQSGPGWRAYELQGVFQWAWEIERPSFWTALTEGYTSVLPLSSADIAAMPCFPILNRLWCMGFEAHVIAQNSGRWIVGSDYFDRRLAELRRWAAAHDELNVEPRGS
jgi:Ser/Thr protein kinase RdoA (MazF antagonist)